MVTKMVIETVGEGACFILKRTNAETGKVSDAETLHSNRYGITVISLSAHGNGCACAVP